MTGGWFINTVAQAIQFRASGNQGQKLIKSLLQASRILWFTAMATGITGIIIRSVTYSKK